MCPLIKAVENCVMNAELSTNICIEIGTHCDLIEKKKTIVVIVIDRYLTITIIRKKISP